MTIDSRAGRWMALVAVLAAAGTASACGGAQADDGQSAASGADTTVSRVINVEVLELETGSFTDLIRLTGTVAASRDVTVSAEESGVIRELPVEKGTRVRSGQPIARIDDRVLRAQVEQARARAELARETWERRKRLWEEDQVGSEMAYLEAKYAAQEARASLAGLEERLERTVVRAPVPGTLDDRMVEVGSMVSPGTPVARVVDTDPVKITGGVPERYAADVAPGDRATVTFDVLGGESFEGTLTYVGASVNPGNRTFPVELTVPNPGRVVKPEMVANIEITREVREDVVVVPREALVRVEDGQVAFVVAEEGETRVAEVRRLSLGPAQRNRIVVESGLEAGDRLIVVGQHQVASGDRIRIVGVRERAPEPGEAARGPEVDAETGR